jgi:hypothetical protein
MATETPVGGGVEAKAFWSRLSCDGCSRGVHPTLFERAISRRYFSTMAAEG